MFFAACSPDVRTDLITPDPPKNILRSKSELVKVEATPDLIEASKTVSSILGEMYKDTSIFNLVNAAISQEYYTDDRILLKDLLYPDNKPVFSKVSTNARKKASEFHERFTNLLAKQAKEAGPNARAKAFDEDYFIKNGITIYFPYSRWFKNKSVNTLTIVAAPAEDSNIAPGIEYSRCGTNVCAKNIMADEKYIQTYPTHVVQAGGADVAKYKLKVFDSKGARKLNSFLGVWIGVVRCIHQYDASFSLTGNGGGSEIRFSRTSAYLVYDTNLQITSPGGVVSVDFPRDYISLGAPIEINAEWDQSWEEGDKEQYFEIWEDDTKGSATYGGSIKTTLKRNSTNDTYEGNANVSITVQTQDNIILQKGLERASFLAANVTDRGWNVFTYSSGLFAPNSFAIYDGPIIGGGGANVSYVMPHKFY